MNPTLPDDPHRGQPVAYTGKPLGEATAAVVMVHGRGATVESILALAPEFQRPGLTYVAPQAAGNTWYPYPFLAPLGQNEPYLTSALLTVRRVLEMLVGAGVPPERTVLLGFSQGACLVLEYAARYAQRFGGVAGLSGGLIGPPGTPRTYPNSLEGTPIFLGCSDADPHIPVERVHETTQVLAALGGVVTEKIYPGLGHTINRDEIAQVTALLDAVTAAA
jgi:phospholipase/carboxylesterase/glyoxalase family protein